MTQAQVPEIIRTPRLTLRPLCSDDRAAITQGVGNYDVARWLSVVPYPYDVSDADWFISDCLEGNKFVRAVCDDSGLIGVVGLDGEYGYWLARQAWGKGYATEMGDAMVDAAFADPDREQVIAGAFVENTRSRHVLKKLGFVDSYFRQTPARALAQDVPSVAMTLTRARWQARRSFRIETDRLILRELSEDDITPIHQLAGLPEVAPMLSSVALNWLREQAAHWTRRSFFRGRTGFRLAVTLKDGTFIGTVGLGKPPGPGEQTCMYWFGPDWWGQGFATEAMRAFLSACYARFAGLDVIEADHFEDNPASGGVLEKLGFQHIGEEQAVSAARLEPATVVLYRVNRQEFEASR